MSSSYLDFHLEFDNGGRLKTKLNDKRDGFTFPLVNFPFISSNIPTYQLVQFRFHNSHYYRACAYYSDFLDGAKLLTQKRLKQDYEFITTKIRRWSS